MKGADMKLDGSDSGFYGTILSNYGYVLFDSGN